MLRIKCIVDGKDEICISDARVEQTESQLANNIF